MVVVVVLCRGSWPGAGGWLKFLIVILVHVIHDFFFLIVEIIPPAISKAEY